MESKVITPEQVNQFCREFVPFGYLDIQTAIDTAIQAGKSVEWAAEQVNEFMDSTGSTNINGVDCVYCVYDSILQEARTEIEELTGYDFMNDNTQGEIETHGNYMATSYDRKDEAYTELIGKLDGIDIETLSETTQWFLNEIAN